MPERSNVWHLRRNWKWTCWNLRSTISDSKLASCCLCRLIHMSFWISGDKVDHQAFQTPSNTIKHPHYSWPIELKHPILPRPAWVAAAHALQHPCHWWHTCMWWKSHSGCENLSKPNGRGYITPVENPRKFPHLKTGRGHQPARIKASRCQSNNKAPVWGPKGFSSMTHIPPPPLQSLKCHGVWFDTHGH